MATGAPPVPACSISPADRVGIRGRCVTVSPHPLRDNCKLAGNQPQTTRKQGSNNASAHLLRGASSHLAVLPENFPRPPQQCIALVVSNGCAEQFGGPFDQCEVRVGHTIKPHGIDTGAASLGSAYRSFLCLGFAFSHADNFMPTRSCDQPGKIKI